MHRRRPWARRRSQPPSDLFVLSERAGFSQYLAQRRDIFLVAYLGYVACYLVRNNVKVAANALVAELSFDAQDVGLILACFSVAYGVGKLAMGVVVDHVSLRALFSGALLLSAILCLGLTWVSTVPVFAVVAVLAGLVQGACAPAALALLASWYPNKARGSRVALWNTSQNVGAALLPLIASGAIGVLGPGSWRATFWLPALLVVAVAGWTYHRGGDRPWREGLPTLTEIYGRSGVPAIDVADRSDYWRTAWRHVFRSRAVLLLAGLNALLYFERFGVINWLKIFLVEHRGLTPVEANFAFSLLEWGAVLGAGGFAFLAWRMPNGMATVGAASMPVLGIAILAYAQAGSARSAILAAGVIGMAVYGPQVIINILTLNLVPSRVLGIAIGVVSLPSYLVGELGANLTQPVLADHLGWTGAHAVVAATSVLAAAMFWMLRSDERAAVVIDR